MEDEYQYLSLGYDCSPAATLRVLNLRPCALPFDWVVSNKQSLKRCLDERFEGYHTDIKRIPSKTRVIDKYGFLFPHDYPTTQNIDTENTTETGDVIYDEKIIVDDFAKYSDGVVHKYKRRIERFLAILAQPGPVIVLMRCSVRDAIFFKGVFAKKYNKSNCIFVVATKENWPAPNFIVPCNPEKMGDWNNKDIWLQAIEIAKTRFGQEQPNLFQKIARSMFQ